MLGNEELPLVSIITPAHNSSRFIRQAIDSVMAQTYPNWEMIVVDDCSKDNTVEIVREVGQGDRRVRLIELDRNVGPGGARNVAIALASGEYLAFLDSDDIWMPQKLATQVQSMIDNGWSFTYTPFRRVSEDGASIGELISLPSSFGYDGLLKFTGIACLTVMLHRPSIGEIRMVERRDVREDFVLWLEILRRGHVAYCVNADLARYRVVSGSDSGGYLSAAKRVWEVYRDIENISIPRSIWCLGHYAMRAYLKRLSLSSTSNSTT